MFGYTKKRSSGIVGKCGLSVGMVVRVKYRRKLHWGKVVLCDPDIGITVVDALDPKEKLFCWHGRLSPVLNWEEDQDECAVTVGETQQLFEELKKHVVVKELYALSNPILEKNIGFGGGGAMMCATGM